MTVIYYYFKTRADWKKLSSTWDITSLPLSACLHTMDNNLLMRVFRFSDKTEPINSRCPVWQFPEDLLDKRFLPHGITSAAGVTEAPFHLHLQAEVAWPRGEGQSPLRGCLRLWMFDCRGRSARPETWRTATPTSTHVGPLGISGGFRGFFRENWLSGRF